MKLSGKQRAILDFVETFRRRHGYPPTFREIASALGISSTSVVSYHLRILEEKGLLERAPGLSRGLRLAEGESVSTIRVPLLGAIAAGEPIPVPEEDRPPSSYERIELTRDIIPDEAGIYALEVRGESMIDALINDGDIVVMRHQKEAQNGEMVAVWLKEEQETTLKRFYRENDKVRLQPANPAMAPIYVHPSKVEIQGKVIMVIRQL